MRGNFFVTKKLIKQRDNMKNSKIPEGIIPPLVTPLDSFQGIDIPALKQLIRKQLKAGTPALFICGTAGLGATLTMTQYETVITTVKTVVPEGYPLLCGVLESSTVRDLERIELLESHGIDYFVTVTPYYLRAAGRDDLLRHFGTLAERTDMEMVLYNIPGCTGVSIPPEVVFEIAKRGWSTMIKDSSGDNDYFETLCTGGKQYGLRVYQGLAPDFSWLNTVGASGCVPVPANRYPELFNEAWAKRASREEIGQIQLKIDSVWNKLVQGTDYITGAIRALAEEGIGNGEMILPFSMAP